MPLNAQLRPRHVATHTVFRSVFTLHNAAGVRIRSPVPGFNGYCSERGADRRARRALKVQLSAFHAVAARLQEERFVADSARWTAGSGRGAGGAVQTKGGTALIHVFSDVARCARRLARRRLVLATRTPSTRARVRVGLRPSSTAVGTGRLAGQCVVASPRTRYAHRLTSRGLVRCSGAIRAYGRKVPSRKSPSATIDAARLPGQGVVAPFFTWHAARLARRGLKSRNGTIETRRRCGVWCGSARAARCACPQSRRWGIETPGMG